MGAGTDHEEGWENFLGCWNVLHIDLDDKINNNNNNQKSVTSGGVTAWKGAWENFSGVIKISLFCLELCKTHQAVHLKYSYLAACKWYLQKKTKENKQKHGLSVTQRVGKMPLSLIGTEPRNIRRKWAFNPVPFLSKWFYQHHQMLELLPVFLTSGCAGKHSSHSWAFLHMKQPTPPLPPLSTWPHTINPAMSGVIVWHLIAFSAHKIWNQSKREKSGLQGTEWREGTGTLQPGIPALGEQDSRSHPGGMGSNCLWPAKALLPHVGGEGTPSCNSASSSGCNLQTNFFFSLLWALVTAWLPEMPTESKSSASNSQRTSFALMYCPLQTEIKHFGGIKKMECY